MIPASARRELNQITPTITMVKKRESKDTTRWITISQAAEGECPVHNPKIRIPTPREISKLFDTF